jgi:putative ABC transport system permease protein
MSWRARVPLGRRNTLAEPRRLVAAVGGVGLALMLILLLDGLWAGIEASITTYEDHVGAELYVAQPGARNFIGATSQLPANTVVTVLADPDVEWAVPVRSFLSIVGVHDRKVPVNVIGYTPGEPGGPWELRSGRAPTSGDEVVVGSTLARQHGVGVGDQLDLLGTRFSVVGTTTDAYMVSFAFITHDAADALVRSPDTTSFVLVGTADPAAVRYRLEAAGLTVLDRDTLARNDLGLVARAYKVPLTVMRGVAFAIGSLVIALTTYSAIAERSREYGIVKAIGASGRDLFRIALQQSTIISLGGMVAGGLLYLVGRAVIVTARPQFAIVATAGNVGRALIAALLMGLVACVVPARRLMRLEPATAYRGG